MITYTFRLYIPFPYLLPPFFSFPLFAPWKIFFGEKEKETLTLLPGMGRAVIERF